MWNPSVFLISNRLYKTQNNFYPLNDHTIKEFSWVVKMAPAVPSTDILWWPVTPVAIVKTIEIVAYLPYQIPQN